MAVFKPLERTQVKPFLRIMSVIMFLSGAASIIVSFSGAMTTGLAFMMAFLASAVQAAGGMLGFIGATKGAFICALIVVFFILAGLALTFISAIQTGDFSAVLQSGISLVIPVLFYISVVRNDKQ